MQNKKMTIFIDSGDTLIDEGSEIRKVEEGVVYAAEFIPGAKEMLLELKQRGYTIVLVADGLKESFDRMYSQHHVSDVFDHRIISEVVGASKPEQIMFQSALDAVGLSDEDKDNIVMIGNNIKRDIVGANRFGIHSVLMAWSPRYCMEPECEEETPEYVIHQPGELFSVLEELENR